MANFNLFIPLLTAVEGGYQDNPNDQGNYNSNGQNVGTQYGISARFYEQIKGFPPSVQDIKSITKSEAIALYKAHFWLKLQADKIVDQYIANTIVDHHVNTGKGVKLAQATLNYYFNYDLATDNIIGNNTLTALNSVHPQSFVQKYNDERKKYYQAISEKDSTFLNGWIKRVGEYTYQHPYNFTTLAIILIALTTFFFIN